MILVDTPIWSEAFRREMGAREIVDHLKRLIVAHLVGIIGPIRQEILSGVKDTRQFDLLRSDLSEFPDWELVTGDYELAAQFFNKCRGKGIQGSNTDFLICAISARFKAPIFTTDKDFHRFSKVLGVRLFEP